MKRFHLMLILFIIASFVCSAKIVTLPEVSKPDFLIVDCHQLYITEGPSIYIYSLTDFTLKKKFGKEGEGPQEFKINSYGGSVLGIDIQPDAILISSVGKLSIYTREGKFKKEMKAPFHFFRNMFMGMGKCFVGTGSTQDQRKNYITAVIYDEELKKVKEACRWENFFKPGKGTRVFDEPIIFQVSDNKIIATSGRDFKLNVFDNKGTILYSIHQEYEKIEISEDLKKEVVDYFKTSPTTKNVFNYMQPIIFPNDFPAIRNFLAKDKKLYITTYRKKDQKTELFIFDLKGNLLKKTFIPIAAQTPLIDYPYNIKDGKLYQLLENDNIEDWDLHILEIE
jgi:hypothetical protein